MKTIIDLLVEPFETIIKGLESLLEKDHEHNAEFGKTGKLLSRHNSGWCVDGRRFTDMQTARRNITVIKNSGEGKTQTHILPVLLNPCNTNSMVVHDNSGELAEASLAYLRSRNVDTKVLNLTKKTGVYINPLDGCKGNVTAIRMVAKSLVGKSTNQKDFFSMYAEDCLSIFMQQVVESEPKVSANLGNVYRLLLEYQAQPKVVERYMAEKASSDVWRKFLALSQNSEKTLKSILASAIGKLSWLGEDPVLCDITSVTNVSFEQFRKQQTVLFVQSPAGSSYYAKMVALIFQSFYRFAFSHIPKDEDLDIMMVQDEFSSMIEGIPGYSDIISNSRKFKVPQAIILQDESQLSPYGELKDNILTNCFLKCYGSQTKKSLELERLLGSYTYTDPKTKKKIKRPLMYASEIQQLKDEILVLVSGQKPWRLKTTPAYKQRRLKRAMQMDIDTEATEEPIVYSIQYIDLEPYRQNVS